MSVMLMIDVGFVFAFITAALAARTADQRDSLRKQSGLLNFEIRERRCLPKLKKISITNNLVVCKGAIDGRVRKWYPWCGSNYVAMDT